MKSSTPRPDEKRAERAVGSTWFEPGHVVADRLRRVAAEEDRAGVADLRREALGVVRLDLQVLGRDRVGERHGVVELADQDHGAEIAPRGGGDRATRQGFQLTLDGALHLVCERRIVGDQDRLRGGVVLGLGQQIGGDPFRIARRGRR